MKTHETDRAKRLREEPDITPGYATSPQRPGVWIPNRAFRPVRARVARP
jgi:hypothetical protein